MKKLIIISTVIYIFVTISAPQSPAEPVNEQTIQAMQTEFNQYLNNIEMVSVDGGCFQMGTGRARPDQQATQEVCLSDYQIGKYEVTQGLWEAVMGNNPSHFKLGPEHPVEMISWQDTQAFLTKLNALTGKSYRLPTEAEWEYACLSGGKDEMYCGSNTPEEVAWFNDHGGKQTKKVGTKKPNGIGIYDMSGNVEEWVQDLFASDYSASNPKDNPTDSVKDSGEGLGHTVRGGEWHCGDIVLLARKRHTSRDTPENDRGFRLVLSE